MSSAKQKEFSTINKEPHEFSRLLMFALKLQTSRSMLGGISLLVGCYCWLFFEVVLVVIGA